MAPTMPVRTKQLTQGEASAPAGGVDVYTVPAGYTALLKDVILRNVSGVTATVGLGVRTASTAHPVLTASLAHAQVVEVSQRDVVLMPGDSIYVQASPAGAVRWLVSGALLEGVAD